MTNLVLYFIPISRILRAVKTAILSVVVAFLVAQTVWASGHEPRRPQNARMHGYESRALNITVQKGGVTSGGGDHSPVRDCVNNFAQVGTINDIEQLLCSGVSDEQKTCIANGLNFAYDLEEIVRSCDILK